MSLTLHGKLLRKSYTRQQANAGAGQQADSNTGNASSSDNNQEVTDVDFEEVK